MKKVHLVLQGKGGVGKSVIASLIAQYKIHKGENPLCIDTDPVNATFEGYSELNVKRLNILVDDEINTRSFDNLIEQIAESEDDVIIDNGASSFVPLSHYLISNDVPMLLKDMGYELVIHTVIAGSQSLLDTINGFSQLITQFPEETLFSVWLNPYWGEIEYQGKTFEQMKAYTNNKHKVSAIIKLPKFKAETYGEDFSSILEKRLTFDQALSNKDLTIMTRQRLKIIQTKIFNLLDTAAVL